MPYLFQDVLKSLNGVTVLRSSVKFPKAFYYGTRFLFDDEPDRGNGYLYVGMASAFRPGDTGQGKAFLLREDVPGTMEDILAQACNVAFVAADTDMLKLFSAVNDLFVQTARVSDSAAYLVSSLTKYSGMPALLDTCAEILHNPVLLGTVQQTHFICSERYAFEDENALASLETYYISREMCSERECAWVRDKLLSKVGESCHLDDYCHEALGQLRDHDTKTNGDYYETLRVFLMCDRNKDAAATALHIHRNTLKYRLKKIAEITHVDMNNTEEMLYLFLSYKMKELSDRLQNNSPLPNPDN